MQLAGIFKDEEVDPDYNIEQTAAQKSIVTGKQ